MDLSRQLLKDFADVTRGVERNQTQYLRGTIKGSGEAKYVRIDGSESLTPISEIVDVQEGDRVLVTIENHEATILGNLTKPPSAYKEQEAIDKAEDAQNSANAAGEAAEDAKSLAQSAGNKADAAVVDATNASASANQAKQDAAAAMTAAENASKNSTEAKDLATAAGQNAATAREEAAAAQNAATAAQGEVTRIEGVVTGVKGDIDTALKEVADQAADLQATKETLEVTYAKKTEVSDVQAALTTEISKKVGELQTTVSQTYAAKNDVVEMEGRLQTQITQTAGEVTSVVGKVEQLESDTTEAQKKVDEALAKSAAAQTAANQAQANATASQAAADAAKADAATATQKANEAVQNAATAAATAAEADKKVAAAQTDLNEAKQNLANTINRVGATEQEIAAAQQKVDAAQAAVTQAQKDAAEATLAANNAQTAANQAQNDATEAQTAATNAQKKADNAAIAAGNAQAAADKAQQDVAALTKRVTSAETAITQNAEQIKLSATKTEEIGNKLDNLSIGSDNLIINGGFPTDTHGWEKQGTGSCSFEVRKHSFYFNEKKNMFCIINRNKVAGYEGQEECIVYSNLFNVKPNTDYTLSFVGFSSSNVASTEVHYMGKINKDDNNYSNITTLFSKAKMPNSYCQYYQYTFNSRNSNVGMIRFDNNGSTNGNNNYMFFSEVMLVEGRVAKKYQPSSADTQSQIDSTNANLQNNYYSKTQTDAAIKVASDNITTTVRKETTEQITNINIGGRNLIVNSELYTVDNPWRRTIQKTDDYRITGMYFPVVKGQTYTFQFCTNRPIGNHEIDGNGKGTTHIMLYIQESTHISSGGYSYIVDLNKGKLTYKDGKYLSTFTIQSEKDYVRALIRIDGHSDGTTEYVLQCWNFQAEDGNKGGSWRPPMESMATKDEVQQAQDYANEANGKADATENRVTVAESTIKQLSDSIAMLVTDSNGSSMMTQTSDGWTFNISSITDSLSNAVNNLDNLTNSVEQSNSTLNNLKQLADDLSNKTAYINMSTDEVGSPCIELGKTDDPFKVRITNRSVDFMDGESKIAYVSNQTLYINQTVVRNELQIGDGSGFVWKTRSNGNLGLRWTTIAKIVITKYRYTQSLIDTYSKNGYTGTWTIVGSTNDINVGDVVKFGVFNTSTNRYNYIEANVNSKGKDNVNTTSTGIVTMY